MLIALLFALSLDEPAPAAPPPTPPAVAQSAPAKPSPTMTPAAGQAPAADSSSAAPATRPRIVLPPATFAPAEDVRFVWRDHPSVRSGDWLRVDFLAKFQLDTRNPGDDPSDFDTLEVHRMRVGIEGTLFRHLEYQVERELTERETSDPDDKSSKTPWKDVYIEANYTPAAQVRAGKFKVPFSLDEMSSESELDFVSRSLGARYLSPGRDVGVEVHGRVWNRALNYFAGVFKQDGDNARSSKIEGADETFAGRLAIRPVPRHSGFEVAASYTTSALANDSFYPNGLRGRTVMSEYVFYEPVYVNGRRQRLGADLDLAVGPLGARAEYMFVSDTRDGQGIGGEDLVDARARAWYALGTWVLTGETKRRPVEPKHGGLFRGGFGAVELAVRYDQLRFDSKDGGAPPFRNSRAVTIFPNTDDVVTLGVNYYANRWMKLQLNAIHERVDDIERSPTADGAGFWSQVFRVQLEL